MESPFTLEIQNMALTYSIQGNTANTCQPGLRYLQILASVVYNSQDSTITMDGLHVFSHQVHRRLQEMVIRFLDHSKKMAFFGSHVMQIYVMELKLLEYIIMQQLCSIHILWDAGDHLL
ncbi:UNKNOWN [Stylonychia lemnae]|uniref:Uncharacterized protein n=1 Tax=Stylonychia lemnae TaxID=5949 RepID=A0A077ZZA3_STYLE|nr:UNKNOWN [Stylonychia lemnae]|eukprot:CDW74917.1 UNKNOWN [Stylonychia lemnae]